MRNKRTPTGSHRGSALIEFGLIGPLFFLLILTVVDAGLLLYTQLTLQSAVSEATRFGITGRHLADPEDPSATLGREASIRAVVDRFAVGLDRDRLEVAIEQVAGDRPVPIEEGGALETLIIRAQYPYASLLAGFFGKRLGVTLYAQAVMRNERFAPIWR